MKAIIIGATSGIGEALAKELAAKGFELGLTGRRTELLNNLKEELQTKTKVWIQTMDVTHTDEARADFTTLANNMGGNIDWVIINAGVGSYANDWQVEVNTIATNVTGFTAIANAAFALFMQQKGGHIAGISSVAAVRGGFHSPVYNASKAFISSYMEGLRLLSERKGYNIAITDIRPGFVKTPMTEKNKGMFWVTPVDKAAKQIVSAIAAKRKVAYISKRWQIVAWIVRHLPDSIYRKMG